MQLSIESIIKLNKFFKNICIKKQYLNKLKTQLEFLQVQKHKNYKSLYVNIKQKKFNNFIKIDNLILYIIDITFSKSNTLIHVMNSSGKLIFFCSAGSLNFKGRKNKKRHFLIFKRMYNILLTKLKFLKRKPIALHLKNVGSSKVGILKQLKSKFFIKIIKNFTIFPYNGCRNKKIRRKKIRTKKNKFFKTKKFLNESSLN